MCRGGAKKGINAIDHCQCEGCASVGVHDFCNFWQLNKNPRTHVMHNYACIECTICVNWPNFYRTDDRTDLISGLYSMIPSHPLSIFIYRTQSKPFRYVSYISILLTLFFPSSLHPFAMSWYVANASQSIRHPLSSHTTFYVECNWKFS